LFTQAANQAEVQAGQQVSGDQLFMSVLTEHNQGRPVRALGDA